MLGVPENASAQPGECTPGRLFEQSRVGALASELDGLKPPKPKSKYTTLYGALDGALVASSSAANIAGVENIRVKMIAVTRAEAEADCMSMKRRKSMDVMCNLRSPLVEWMRRKTNVTVLRLCMQ